MTKEEALLKVKGCLTDYFPLEDYDEVEEIMNALEQEPMIITCKDCSVKQFDKSESEEVGAEKYFCSVVGNYVDETPNFYCANAEK